MEKERFKPEGATHDRDGEDYYRVTDNGVYYFEYGEWKLCDNGHDIASWLEELTPVT